MPSGRRKGDFAKYYKGKYMLAVYDFDDNLIQVFDNCHQLAEWFDTTYEAIVAGVGRVLSGYCKYLLKKGTKYKVYTIDAEEE